MHNKVQSVIFPKSEFSQAMAVRWLASHNYDHQKHDVTDRFHRFRQFDPVPGAKYHTVKLGNDIELVISVDSDSDAHSVSSVESKSSVESTKPMAKPMATKAPRKATEAQIKHRALFAQWAKSKSGMKFGEWKAKQSEPKPSKPEVKEAPKKQSDWFKQMLAKKNKK